MKRSTLRLLAATFALLTLAATASAALSGSRQVTEIRTYSSGLVSHITVNSSVSTTCGTILRVTGDGQDLIIKVALAAMLSGKNVRIDHSDVPDGSSSYCVVNHIRILQ